MILMEISSEHIHPSKKPQNVDTVPNQFQNVLIINSNAMITISLSELKIFGNDYDTLDGTGVRDYIHVNDLAIGHIKALKKISGFDIFNLGTGQGHSVLEILNIFERVTDSKIPHSIANRRNGDVAVSYANVSRSREKLDWVATKNIEQMCEDVWKWQTMNPNGY
jgi:UDP-glucose 4-epimerase